MDSYATNETQQSFDIESPNDSISTFDQKDWRLDLFGPSIESNQKTNPDTSILPTDEALDPGTYDYVAIFFTADYCPYCKEFAPKLLESRAHLINKRCKIIAASNDRSAEAFENTRQKLRDIDFLPYDTARIARMRDMFGLKTIPAVVVVKNDHFERESPVVETTDGRNAIVADPSARNFPWRQSRSRKAANVMRPSFTPMSLSKRFIIQGEHGRWYHLGHAGINPDRPEQIYMDEYAVRIRAGIINFVTWLALFNVFYWRSPTFFLVAFPIVLWDFGAGSIFGLVPLAPIGTVATLISMMLHPNPMWKPARPKRFAWTLGFFMVSIVVVLFVLRHDLAERFQWSVASIIIMANFLTWLEAACGFCVGCFMYTQFLVPKFGLEECVECTL